MVEARLPPGFRFRPKDEELVCDYLMKKVARCEQPPFLIQVDLNKSEPWDIPVLASVGGKELYFYSRRDRKYATGLRTNRATILGYWKATGKDKPVVSHNGSLIGMRKTLVFYLGRAPRGKKSDWVMHEFRLEGPLGTPELEEDWVLCRVICKNKEVVVAKQGMGIRGCCNEDTTTSSSTNYYDLPPLMDIPPPPPPYITFGQTHEQVPCISNIFSSTPNQTNCPTLFSNSNSHHIMMKITKHLEQQPNISSKLTTLLPTIYNNNNNLQMSFGEGSNSEISLSSEIGGFPTIWDNRY